MGTDDAVARETAWLSESGDGLPALLKADGGPFDDVHAYWPTVPEMAAYTLYVTRLRTSQTRFADQLLMSGYALRLIVWWPLLAISGAAEDSQQAMDAAVELVLQRVAGPVPVLGQHLDKTHGGRFLSVAENPRQVDVDFAAPFGDPVQTIPQGFVAATVTYSADDPEDVG